MEHHKDYALGIASCNCSHTCPNAHIRTWTDLHVKGWCLCLGSRWFKEMRSPGTVYAYARCNALEVWKVDRDIRIHLRWMKLLTRSVFRTGVLRNSKSEATSGVWGIYLYLYNWLKFLSLVQVTVSWDPTINFQKGLWILWNYIRHFVCVDVNLSGEWIHGFHWVFKDSAIQNSLIISASGSLSYLP